MPQYSSKRKSQRYLNEQNLASIQSLTLPKKQICHGRLVMLGETKHQPPWKKAFTHGRISISKQVVSYTDILQKPKKNVAGSWRGQIKGQASTHERPSVVDYFDNIDQKTLTLAI